jgi:hypothetical protein
MLLQVSSKILGFGSDINIFKFTISRVGSSKCVLGLIFSSTRCDNPNGFVHFLATPAVGSGNSKRTSELVSHIYLFELIFIILQCVFTIR